MSKHILIRNVIAILISTMPNVIGLLALPNHQWAVDMSLSLTHWSLGNLDAILKKSIFNLVSLTGICKTSYANTLRWMPLDLTEGKSRLVQVMAWCPQATSHYLSQCWSRSISPNGAIRPQWVNDFPSWKCWEASETIKQNSRRLWPTI